MKFEQFEQNIRFSFNLFVSLRFEIFILNVLARETFRGNISSSAAVSGSSFICIAGL